jgi:hypothetical protein
MKYDQVRELLRERFLAKLEKVEPDAQQIASILADKLMALEFSKTISKGITNQTQNSFTYNYQQRYQREFFLLARATGITLFAGFKVCFFRKSIASSKPASSLVYGLSKEHLRGSSDMESLRLFFDQHLENIGLTPSDFYLVQTGSLFGNCDFGRVKLVPYLGIEMLKYQTSSRKTQLNNLSLRFISLLRLARVLPEILEIGAEYIIDYSVFAEITNIEIRSLITTQSQMLVLPMAFYQEISPNRLMFWYSDNSTQIQKLEFEKQLAPDYSYLIQNRIRIHFVWTTSWASVLKKFTQAKILIIGPILFKLLPESKSELECQPNAMINILVFDVTPKKSASYDNYYSFNNMAEFLLDLVEIVQDLAPTALLTLKPKRKYSDADDLNYIRLVKSLKARIKLLAPTQDLVALIGNSDLVICVPFTSPALLAKTMGKQVFYYSPSLQFNLPLEYEGIRVISGKKSLRQVFGSIVK